MLFPLIKCIFFAEFHPVQGPKVAFCTPDSFPVHAIFDSVSECLIPKPPLCDSLVAICVEAYKIIGYPIMIENSKYNRNVSIWNLAMVFEREAPTYGAEKVIKKLAGVLKTMEIENEFLHNATTKASIQEIIDQLIDDLNFYKESHIALNDTYSINLKLFPVYLNPPEVHDHQVPVAIVDLKATADCQWDKSLYRVIHHINGVNYIGKIAELADVDLDLTKACMQHLIVNVSIRQLARDENIQVECSHMVTRPGAVPPTPTRLLTLYSLFKPGVLVKDIVDHFNFPVETIDIRRFIIFGVLRKWLIRIHRWPVIMDNLSITAYTTTTTIIGGGSGANSNNNHHLNHLNNQSSGSSDHNGTNNTILTKLKRMMDGSMNTDQMCVMFKLSYKELCDLLSSEMHVMWFEK